MVALPDFGDATLDLADRQLELSQDKRRRRYLGMSAIGKECERDLWYGFRWVQWPSFDAATLKRFADGHASETVAVERLKAVPELELHEVDDTGEQFGFSDLGGHFSGHMDGVVLGLIQAPKTWHVLEIKASEKWQDVDKAKKKVGEKSALLDWNATYYAQAVLYMHYAGLDRHYLVCVSPGARRWTSVRTNADPVAAIVLIQKAERIIFSDNAPARIGDATNFKCKWCDNFKICHEGKWAERNCRTCMFASADRDGEWRCHNDVSAHVNQVLTVSDQDAGCPCHRYLPDLVPGEQVDAGAWGIKYKISGSEWVDAGQGVLT